MGLPPPLKGVRTVLNVVSNTLFVTSKLFSGLLAMNAVFGSAPTDAATSPDLAEQPALRTNARRH